jgi:hypothetical protein
MVKLIASLLTLQHDRLFPVLNYTTPIPVSVAAVRTATIAARPETSSTQCYSAGPGRGGDECSVDGAAVG